MKRTFKILLNALAIILSAACLFSCSPSEKQDGCGEPIDVPEGNFKMIATVMELGEKITVNVTEAEYASGIHWVIISNETVIADKNDCKLDRSDLRVGDILEITYNGQVMMSLPPQIVAISIRRM